MSLEFTILACQSQNLKLLLTNPALGKKSTIAIVNEEGDLEKEDGSYELPDFWTSTKNKQLNFLQHVKSLLKINGHVIQKSRHGPTRR